MKTPSLIRYCWFLEKLKLTQNLDQRIAICQVDVQNEVVWIIYDRYALEPCEKRGAIEGIANPLQIC